MINNKNNTNDFLRDLVRKSDIKTPSSDFTLNVMKGIETEALNSEKNVLKYKYAGKWIYFASGLGFAITLFVYYYLNTGSTFISESFNPLFIPIFEKLFANFRELFGSFRISSITLVIILAIASLFLVDRLLKKFQAGKNIYFSF